MDSQVCRIGLCWLMIITPAIGCAHGAEAQLTPMFPPAPRLATTAAEIADWKSSGEFDRLQAAAKATGEKLLAAPVEIPTEWGNWIFYYACTDDGTTLSPVSLTEHRCPKCGKVFTDERTVASYRTQLYYNADRAALDLGWAYLFTEDDRFASEVRRILTTYATSYRNYPSRRDRWGREGLLATIGGRRYCQSLDEAVGIIQLAKAYDLTRTSSVWSEADRRHVEQNLFGAVTKILLHWNYGTINHQTWYNAGLMSIANVTADAQLAKKVITMTGGYRDQLARSIGPDGMWREGTLAYHSYALQAMEELVDAGQKIGLRMVEEPRLRLMFEFPAAYAYPNGQFPAINDSDPMNLASFDHHFRWAWQTYHDEQFARAYARGNPERTKELLGPEASVTAPEPQKSMDLPGAGVVVLRRGLDADAACAMLDYGEHGDAHGHPDKLQLLLFARGREWLLDPGRLSYSHKEFKTWYRQTAAHNTVVINGRSQTPCTGRLRWLAEHPEFAACIAECDQAYSGVKLRRSLVLLPDGLIDVCTVDAPTAKTIDWLMHAVADTATIAEAESTPANPLGQADGYEHLTDVQRWDQHEKNVRCDLKSGDQTLPVHLTATGVETLYTAKGFGYTLEPKLPCVIRRAAGGQIRFAAVYDWAEGDRRVAKIMLRADGSVMVHRQRGTTAVSWAEQSAGVEELP